MVSSFRSTHSLVIALRVKMSKQLPGNRVDEELRCCTKVTCKLNRQLKDAKTVGRKRHLEAELSKVKSTRRQMQKQGGVLGRSERTSDRVCWDDMPSAFNGRIRTSTITNLKNKDVYQFLEDCKNIFTRRIRNAMKIYEAIKVNTVFNGEFTRQKADSVTTDIKHFTTPNSLIYRHSQINDWFDSDVKVKLLTKLEEFQESGSGWALSKIINLEVNVMQVKI